LIAAIVLSAGKSERMGSPKALLRHGGKTFLESTVDAVRTSSLGQAIVVLGHHRDEIVAALDLPGYVYNPDYEQGMTTSFQAGIRALEADAVGAMLFLVDHPIPDVRTIEALVRAFRPGHVVVPVFDGRRGHPVLFSRELLEEILLLPPDTGANTVVRRDSERVIQVVVPDAGVLEDIDTPEQFNDWTRRSGDSF
jgi:molybdenum cofactor cytidylyltransferase